MKKQNIILLIIIILIMIVISIILINNLKNNDGNGETCDYNSEIKKYVGKSAGECALISVLCEQDRKYFADECGCGCELIQK